MLRRQRALIAGASNTVLRPGCEAAYLAAAIPNALLSAAPFFAYSQSSVLISCVFLVPTSRSAAAHVLPTMVEPSFRRSWPFPLAHDASRYSGDSIRIHNAAERSMTQSERQGLVLPTRAKLRAKTACKQHLRSPERKRRYRISHPKGVILSLLAARKRNQTATNLDGCDYDIADIVDVSIHGGQLGHGRYKAPLGGGARPSQLLIVKRPKTYSSQLRSLQGNWVSRRGIRSKRQTPLNTLGRERGSIFLPRTYSVRYTIRNQGYIMEGVNRSRQPTRCFQPSPRLRAPHSTSFFTGNTLSEQATSDKGNGVNGQTDSEGIGQSKDQSSSSTRSQKGTPQLNESSASEHNPSSLDRDMKGRSDPNESNNSEQENDSGTEQDPDSDMEVSEEGHTPLSYQIPSKLLDDALQAPPRTRASYWSQKLYRGPHGELLSVHYCRNMEVAERVAKYFVEEKAVGFDIEWRPWASSTSIKENVSLIQLACEDRIALFHIALFPGKTPEQLLPPTLKTIIESPNIYKVGVAVKGDCSRIEKYLNTRARGVFELSRLHNLVEHYATNPDKVNRKLTALTKQVHQHLLLPLYKGEPLIDDPPSDPDKEKQEKGSVRASDWTQRLDIEQIQYAADDAYAGFRLFDVLESKRKKLKPTPPQLGLCDFDPPTEPRPKSTKSKSTASKKEKVDANKAVAEALGAAQVDEAEDDTQEYETAPEEFEEEEEDSESESEGSEAEENHPDADYVPRKQNQVGLESSSPAPRISSRRVGRFDFSRFAATNPRYPTLPKVPTDGENMGSDSTDAFEPLSKPQLQLLDETFETGDLAVVSSKNELKAGQDEFADPELEEALLAMDIDKKPDEVENTEVTEEEEHKESTREAHGGIIQSDAIILDTEPMATRKDDKDKETHVSSSSSELSTTPLPTFMPLAPDNTSRSPEFEQADSWAESYLQSTIPSASTSAPKPSSIRATKSHLRAYHLWHHQQRPVEDIASHLRDPPLAHSTVSSYILQAVTLEKLEYRDEDMRVVLRAMPLSLRMGRWKWLCQKLGVV